MKVITSTFLIYILILSNCLLNAAESADMQQQIDVLRNMILEMKKDHDKQVSELKKQIASLKKTNKADATEENLDLSSVLDSKRQGGVHRNTFMDKKSRVGSLLQSLNPDISVIVDTLYHYDDSEHGIEDLFSGINRFGHSHGHDEHDHEHPELEKGFNLRHLELFLSAEVDPYFYGRTIVGIQEEGIEIEEAVLQTTFLPAGLQLTGGKFYSGIGRINSQHSHSWDFTDQPLIYQLVFGEHALNDKGVQLTWLAPVNYQILAGVEAFHGENELVFDHIGGDHLPEKDGPRLFTGWLKFSPNLPDKHGLQLGLFGGRGIHQEEHDEDEDEQMDHWLHGHSIFWGADFVYKYDSGRAHGRGDFTLQGEYLSRQKKLKIHHTEPTLGGPPLALIGENVTSVQDGFYIQALYGFMERWRFGLRSDVLGITNWFDSPEGKENFGSSYRYSAMIDFMPSEFSLLRLQLSHGDIELENGNEDFWQLYLQWMISLGSHGAHNF